MQVALLSTLEPSADDPATPRGLLRLGGRSVIHSQLGIALALGCERVICAADGMPGEVLALQHAAERAGAGFHVAAGGQGLARLIKPIDELLVLADGVIASPMAVAELLGPRDAVVVQPAESGIGAGYERIDLDHAEAGVFRVSGRLVSRLAELPPDWSPVSALLRIAVQEGVRQVPLPSELVERGQWMLLRSDADAHRFEPGWLRLHTSAPELAGPGAWLAGRLVERLGPTLLHAGTRPFMIAVAAAILVLFGLGIAWGGFPASGFVLLGLAYVVRRAGALLARIDRELHTRRRRLPPESTFAWVLDTGFVLAAMWRFQSDPGSGTIHSTMLGWVAAFVALVLFGLLRLIPQVFADRRWARWFEDRLAVALALAAASLSGVFGLALMAAGLVLLAIFLVAAHDRERDGAARQPLSP